MLRPSKINSYVSYLFSLLLMGVMFNADAQTLNNSLSFSVIKTANSGSTLEAMVVDGGSWFTLRKLAYTAVLVHHPKGDFLWDSGLGFEVEAQRSVLSFLEKHILSIENVHPAYEQLIKSQYDIKSLMAIIPSHMHWDHASGLEDFLGIPVWLQQSSFDEAQNGKPPAFIKSQYDSPDLNWHIITLPKKDYLGFHRSQDIYGDGSAILVDLTGHTQGQFGLFLNLDNGQSYFFIGDATWSIIGIEKNKSRPSIVQKLFHVDSNFDKNAKVVEQIHNLSIAYPELVIIPAHDELQLKKLPIYPRFSH